MNGLFNQVSVFAKAVHDKARWVTQIQLDAKKFSDQLQIAMGLTEKDMEDADDLRVEWHTANYTISARHFAHHRAFGNWTRMLYARGRELNEPGWGNFPFECNESDWEYYPKGTGTVLLPKLHTQAKILKEIADVLQSSKVMA